MLQEVAYHQNARTVTCRRGFLWHLRFERHTADFSLPPTQMRSLHPRLWDTTQDQSRIRMRECRSTEVCAARTGREELISSTKGAHHYVGAAGQAEGGPKIVDVSAMEVRVLDLTRRGKTTKEIAATLCIPEHMVALHVRHSLKCLRARSVEELLSLVREYH